MNIIMFETITSYLVDLFALFDKYYLMIRHIMLTFTIDQALNFAEL